MQIIVHQLNKAGTHCQLCSVKIPATHHAKPLEYVALTTYSCMEPTAYRIGDNNQEPLCSGAPAKEFSQKSIPLPKKKKALKY